MYKWLQVEATTKCNAWCPGCARNNGGYGLTEFTLEDLDCNRFTEVLDQLPDLEVIDFCGTYGDAIAAANFIELTNIAKRYAKKIIVRTNGSLRSTQWWTDYANLIKDVDHDVWFCLDGLQDTHSIYRQATDWNKIIANASAFISAGGTATWQFIPWQHNEHQIKDCLKLSQQLGFKNFKLVTRVRQNFSARHYTTGEPVDIKPWGQVIVNSFTQPKNVVHTKNCMHIEQPSIYLNANGSINVCCHLNLQGSVTELNQLPNIPELLLNGNYPKSCLHHCGTPT
jgi:hypothetical protein